MHSRKWHGIVIDGKMIIKRNQDRNRGVLIESSNCEEFVKDSNHKSGILNKKSIKRIKTFSEK